MDHGQIIGRCGRVHVVTGMDWVPSALKILLFAVGRIEVMSVSEYNAIPASTLWPYGRSLTRPANMWIFSGLGWD